MSPFLKGGFRGIIKRFFNPPYPPLEKGGIKTPSCEALISEITPGGRNLRLPGRGFPALKDFQPLP